MGYLCFDKSKFGHLEEEVKKLLERIDRVQYMVDVDKLNGEENERNVENWLIRVDRIIDQAEKTDEEAKKQRFKGLCVNSTKWYRLGKKAAMAAKAVVELLEEGKFDQVSNSAISNGDYVSFESRKSIRNGVLDALINPDVNMIGVYGMSGIGKTMLVKEMLPGKSRKTSSLTKWFLQRYHRLQM